MKDSGHDLTQVGGSSDCSFWVATSSKFAQLVLATVFDSSRDIKVGGPCSLH